MVNIKDITGLAKSGKTDEAYSAAKANLDAHADDIWAQRAMGWALYYLMKSDVEKKADSSVFLQHLEELAALENLKPENESITWDCVLWTIGKLLRNINTTDNRLPSAVFRIIGKYAFPSTKGYSFLLETMLRFKSWDQKMAFIEWWNLDKLMPEDYHEVKTAGGRSIMSLAERVYIAYAKALCILHDQEKATAFLPRLQKLANEHPEMLYPDYFCGKLMLATGSDKKEGLKIIMPFVRKKKGEFWTWLLVGELFEDDDEKRLACLLRAAHCKTSEEFLINVRLQLARLYIKLNDFPRARYQLDLLYQCVNKNGWKPKFDMIDMSRNPNIVAAKAESGENVDYKTITNALLLEGCKVSIGLAVYVNNQRKTAVIVYGEKLMTKVKPAGLGMKVHTGMVLRLHWTAGADGNINILYAEKAPVSDINGLSYIKVISGTVSKKNTQDFAFIHSSQPTCFVAPEEVKKYALTNGIKVKALTALCFNKKKNNWSWKAVSVKAEKQ